MANERTCWVVSDGRRGIENQALGLAEAIRAHIPLRIVRLHAPRPRGPASFPFAAKPRPQDLTPADAPDPEQFWASSLLAKNPWPTLWIGCGRTSAPYAEALRTWSGGRTYVVQVQHPRRPVDRFDLVLPPAHDGLEADERVAPLLGSPNRVTLEGVRAAAAGMASLEGLPRPRAAVLIGGKSKRHRMTPAVQRDLMDTLERLARRGHGLMITTSRRTPPAFCEALRRRFAARAGVVVWTREEDGPNPYLAFLGAADVALVTKDSTNMLTEAASAGLPVLLLPMAGSDGKFTALYDDLERAGRLRRFLGELETWPVTPLTETQRAAALVVERLAQHGGIGQAGAPGGDTASSLS